jgi:hypothetical protein
VEPNGENGDRVPPHGSLASLEEVDGLVEPEKKKKRAKRAKKVKFDDVSYLSLCGPGVELISRTSKSNTMLSRK